MAPGLQDDPRWQRFNDQSYRCPCCGGTFGGVFDMVCHAPSPWPHGPVGDLPGRTRQVDDDRLTSDLCSVGEHRFIRGVLEIPIIGTDQRFGFGAWASVHPDRFADYVAAFGTDRELDLGGFFGWLSNDLPGYCEGRFVKVDVILQGGSARPLFFAHDDEMPLARDQREGISFDALLDLYARCGRDIRPHLEPH